VFDKVTIAYRGAGYELGQGRGFYGVWAVGAPRHEPLQRWAETPEGWSAAWTRFASMEAPGTIVPVGRSTSPVGPSGSPVGPSGSPVGPSGSPASEDPGSSGPYPVPYGAGAASGGKAGAVAAAVLIGVGVVLGVAGLFPGYLGSVSLTDRTDQVLPHAIYLGVWTVSAVLILLGGARLRIGALLSLGLSAVTFGLFFSDVGLAVSGTGASGGTGLVLSAVGWGACTAGTVLAFLVRPAAAGRTGSLGRPTGAAVGPAVMLVLAGLGVAAAFAPAWDSFTLRTAAGQTQSLTLGDAFSGSTPGLVITGDVLVMLAVAVTVVLAAFWRPVRHGGVLLAGVAIPMAAQAISALVQAGQPASPAQFGISNAQATQLGLTISSGVTPAFWIYCAFLAVLLVSCAWMLFTPQQAFAARPVPSAEGGGYGLNAPRPEDLPAEPQDSDSTDSDSTDDQDATGPAEPAPAAGREAWK
jgi:hypothetical protein